MVELVDETTGDVVVEELEVEVVRVEEVVGSGVVVEGEVELVDASDEVLKVSGRVVVEVLGRGLELDEVVGSGVVVVVVVERVVVVRVCKNTDEVPLWSTTFLRFLCSFVPFFNSEDG